MSVKCSEIINIMEQYAPSFLAESWDNVGLMVGDTNQNITKILVALDINDEVIDEAIQNNCQMIITHHPFIFKGIKNVTTDTHIGKQIINIIKHNICVYSAHTNLDIAQNGTNDTLLNILNLKKVDNLFENENTKQGLGRVAQLQQPTTFKNLIQTVKSALGLSHLVVCGNMDTNIKKIAVCTGSGGEIDFMNQAIKKGCNAYITGDLKYHNAQMAKELGLCVIDASHYETEVIIVPVICDYINRCAKRLNMQIECIPSKTNGQTLNIV